MPSENEAGPDAGDTDEVKHIHFLTDVKDLGAAYECRRCGHATATTTEMKWHRDGIISECDWRRLKEWFPW